MVSLSLLYAFVACIGGVWRHQHVLVALMCLECAVLVSFVTFSLSADIWFATLLVSVGAVEGAVGLGCLVGLVRQTGRGQALLS